jgi:hypothetical protein
MISTHYASMTSSDNRRHVLPGKIDGHAQQADYQVVFQVEKITGNSVIVLHTPPKGRFTPQRFTDVCQTTPTNHSIPEYPGTCISVAGLRGAKLALF